MPFNQLREHGDGDWRVNWSVIDAFIRQWLNPDYVRAPKATQICELERSADVILPPSAHEWCSFALASEQIKQYFSFRDCFVIERLKDHKAVSLLLQGEADFYWAIETQSLNDFDPPVTAYGLDYDAPGEHFINHGQWSPTVSSFAFDYLLTYLHSPGGGFNTRMSSERFSLDALVADFGKPIKFGHLFLFIAEGVLIALTTCPGNWHHGVVKVVFRHKNSLKNLANPVQRLFLDAHVTYR